MQLHIINIDHFLCNCPRYNHLTKFTQIYSIFSTSAWKSRISNVIWKRIKKINFLIQKIMFYIQNIYFVTFYNNKKCM